jgi:IS5 family transposase
LAADKGYSYPSVRAELRRRGIAAVIAARACFKSHSHSLIAAMRTLAW